MSELLALGISHKTAAVELRERLALPDTRRDEFVRELTTQAEIDEAVAISTCNRTELYLVVGDPVEAEAAALGALASLASIRPTELADAMYSPRNCDAARHLYRVTSGLESMIVGEAEVQGQVRRAYEAAQKTQTTGPLTNRLFQAALATGGRVRSETAIGEGHLSVASVAVELARDLIGDLSGKRVVLIGTGETGELTAQALAHRGASPIFVANRRRDRARALAERYGGETVGIEDMPAAMASADIVVASTASPHAVVEVEELELVMRERKHRPLLLIDLAVPRDIDPQCLELDGVTLHDIDDLQAVVRKHRSVRRAEARRAESIVEEEIQSFARWLGALETLPTVRALREHGDAIVEQVLAENAGRWESASERDRTRIEAALRSVMNRLLHEPTVRLKRASAEDRRTHMRVQVLREMFGLEERLEEAAAQSERPVEEAPGNVRELPRRARR